MPRKSSVWFREQAGYYYTTYQRKQHRLTQDEQEAELPPYTAIGPPAFGQVARLLLAGSGRHDDDAPVSAPRRCPPPGPLTVRHLRC